ncbi:MAG: ATP-binding protein [Acidimicrobiia bacterium]
MVEAPIGFDGVIGHSEIVTFLRGQLAAAAHAYLFVGAGAVGKATVAREFARLLLCPEGGGHEDPCRSCRRVASGNHPDLVLVEPEGRTSLGVDQARAVVTQAALTPVESNVRIFLFEEAGAMTEQASNSLLKTLEEPSSPVIFLLVAESEDDFPPTVASRCRTVRFGRVADEELTAALMDLGVEPDPARVAAMVAGGRPGLALALATRPEVAAVRQAWLSLPERVTARPGDGFALAEEMLATIEPIAVDLAGGEATAEARERSRKRATQSLVASGLEILASFYVDGASLQMGGPIRNRDVPLPVLASVPPARSLANAQLVLDAVVDLAGNLRQVPVLASLFTALATE